MALEFTFFAMLVDKHKNPSMAQWLERLAVEY